MRNTNVEIWTCRFRILILEYVLTMKVVDYYLKDITVKFYTLLKVKVGNLY